MWQRLWQNWSAAPTGGWWTVAAAAFILVVLLRIGPSAKKLTPGRRRVLVLLRLAAIAVSLWTLVRPSWVHLTRIQHPSSIVLVADRSRSMQVQDVKVGNRTRWQAERQALDGAAEELARFDKSVDIKLYTFDEALTPVPLVDGKADLGETSDGKQTAIGAALAEVLRQHAGQRLTSVILLSDGAQRAIPPHDLPPQGAARRLGDLGCALYVVPFGQDRGPGQRSDVAVDSLVAPSTVYIKNQLPVSGTVRIDGFVNKDVACQLLFETSPGQMSPVGATQLRTLTDGRTLPVDFDYVPTRAGEFKVTLSVPPQPGELLTTNNELSTFVTVLSGGVNVLYLEGAPRVEQKFIRRVLDSSPNINVDYFRIDAQHPETRPADLDDRFTPGRYDVYLLGDLDSRAFDSALLKQLASAVERGAGLMMLGGFHSFGAGGYGRTPLADVLPIEIDRLERQNFNEPIRDDLQWNQPLRMRPTNVGRTQSLLMLAAGAKNEQLWAQLPKLEGANRFRGLKPTAQTLAESDDGKPLLVANDFGAGRVLAFAGDSTWHWAMSGFEAEHRRFWRQTILWLARKEETEGRVLVRLDQRRFAPGSRVEFGVAAVGSDGHEVTDASFTAEVVAPDRQTLRAQIRRQANDTLGTFADTNAAGDYLLRVTAQRGAEMIGIGEARFLVYQQDLEMDNPASDIGLLKSLAAMTPGRVVPPEQLPELLKELRDHVAESQIEVESKTTLYDNPWVLALFIALVSVEWYLRKRWGLV